MFLAVVNQEIRCDLVYLECKLEQDTYGWYIFELKCQKTVERIYLERSTHSRRCRWYFYKKPHFFESITSEIFQLWSWFFFSKCTKFCADCENAKKVPDNVFRFWDDGIQTRCGNFSQIITRIHVIGSQRVTKQSWDFRSD